MIKGFIEINILHLFPENDFMEILKTQGFKSDGDCYYKLLLNADDKIKYSPLKVMKDYYYNQYHKFLIDGENKNLKYVKLNKLNILEEKTIASKDEVDAAINSQNVMYDPFTRQFFIDNNTVDILKGDLEGQATVNRYSFKNLEKNTGDLLITYDIDDAKHNYYNEFVDTYFLSNQSDNYFFTSQKFTIDSCNHKYEELKKIIELMQDLISKLGTNPAVVGSPILLPTDTTTLNQAITQINQTLNNNFSKEYDIIDMINQSLGGILHAKQ